MFWPYEFTANNQPQYFNPGFNFCPPFLSNDLAANPLTNILHSSLFDFSQPYTHFPQGCPSSHTVDASIQCPSQNLFGNPSYPIQTQLQNLNNNEEVGRVQGSEEHISQSQGLIRMVRFRRRRQGKKEKNKISHNSSLRNDTKNIPKNYGKAMLAYIQKNTREAKQLLEKWEVDFMEFMMTIKKFKSKINTIHDLREMWGEDAKEDKLKKCIRILSFHFMRKKCLPYIFNSRVKNYHTHIKYRKKIMEGIQNPENFTKIKQF